MTQAEPRAAWALCGLAMVLVFSQATLVWAYADLRQDTPATFALFWPLFLLLAAPTALGLASVPWIERVTPNRTAIAVMVLTGMSMRAVAFGSGPLLEDDHYRYLWDGALVAHGFDPYLRAPLDFISPGELSGPLARLATEGREVLERINFPELRSIYPGTAQALFALAHVLMPWRLDGLRLVAGMCDIATLILLVHLLKRMGRSALWAAFYWANPLVVFTLGAQAHVDVALPPLVLGALLAAQNQRAALCGFLLGLAAGVKIWPVLLVPLVARLLSANARRVGQAVLSFALVTAIVLGPLLVSAFRTGSGLTAYAGSWSNNNAFYAWAAWVVREGPLAWHSGEMVLRATLALVVTGVAIWQARRPVTDTADMLWRALIIATTLFYLSPAQFPWYAAWFLPFAAALANRPLLLASALLPIYYLFFPFAAAGRLDAFLFGVAFLHAVPVLAWLTWRHARRRREVFG